MTFLKIISFSVRLIFFMVSAIIAFAVIIAGLISGLLFVPLFKFFASDIGTNILLVSLPVVLMYLILEPEKYLFSHNTIIDAVIFIIAGFIVMFVVNSFSEAIEKIYKFPINSALHIFKFVKLILL